MFFIYRSFPVPTTNTPITDDILGEQSIIALRNKYPDASTIEEALVKELKRFLPFEPQDFKTVMNPKMLPGLAKFFPEQSLAIFQVHIDTVQRVIERDMNTGYTYRSKLIRV
jgi:hypothetical protein